MLVEYIGRELPMIRRAGPADVATLHSLVRELASYEQLESQRVSTEEQIHAHLFGSRPYAEALLAEEAGTPVGFAVFFHNYSTFVGRPGLYVEDVFVRPEHRRKGHGRSLFRELAGIAVDRGCARFEWSVLDWNEPAIAFYGALGATVMPNWRICRMTGAALANLAGKE